MTKHFKLLFSLLLLVLLFSGFWSGKSKEEIKEDNRQKRVERIKTSNETLDFLYKYAPEAKEIIRRSYGYATFSSVGVNLIVLSAEGGAGMAHSNKTGINTYMNMASGGLGFGVGVKDFRAIFLFENKKVYDNFVNYGWEANAQVDAALKYGDKGGSINGAVTVASGVRLYKLTQNGLAFQATIQGTKYYKDTELNKN